MGCDNWSHAESRRQTDERVAVAVAEMTEAGVLISPWRVQKRHGIPAGSVAKSLDRLGIEWNPTSFEAAGCLGEPDPPTPEEIRERAVLEWVGRYEDDVIDLAEAVAELVRAKASRIVPDIIQRARRLKRARRRLHCAIGGYL